MTASSTPFVHATGHHGFRDGKYYRYTKTSVTVMAGWPRMLAWQRSAQKPAWRLVRPDCGRPSLIPPVACKSECATSLDGSRSEHCQRREGDCLRAHDPWAHWSALIPFEIRTTVAKFRERHWHLLSLAARCGQPAVDLMHSNPSLAWALASSWVFRSTPVRDPMRSARRLLAPGKSQRDIMAWLGFPSSDAARRNFAKLRHESIGVNTLLALRDALRDPVAMKLLCHLPSLNHGVVRLVSDAAIRPFVSHQLLSDVLNDTHSQSQPGGRPLENEYARAAMTLHDCLRMLDFLGVERHRLAPPRSLPALEKLHEELVLRQQQHIVTAQVARSPTEVLAPPPIPGNAQIIPLMTEQLLQEEGLVMHHCIASYGPLVATGRCAIYRILAPERATLAIVPKGNRWVLSEMKCVTNREADPSTRNIIEAWLSTSVHESSA